MRGKCLSQVFSYSNDSKLKRIHLTQDESSKHIFFSKTMTTPILGLRKSVIYRFERGFSTPLLKVNGYISSLMAYCDCLYYVTHDSFTLRGKLCKYRISDGHKETILNEEYGCGSILGIFDGKLYIEVEDKILLIHLDRLSIETISHKHYYLTASTEKGITYYDDTVTKWFFREWDNLSAPEQLAVAEDKISSKRVFAWSQQRFLLYDIFTDTLEIHDNNSVNSFKNVTGFCLDDNSVYIIRPENSPYSSVYRIDFFCDNPSDFLVMSNVRINSNCCVINNTLYFLNANDDLSETIGDGSD